MPNHVTNILSIFAEEALYSKILSEISNFEGSEPMWIDFNKICPLPQELEGSCSPPRIVSQEEYDAQEIRLAKKEYTEEEIKFGVTRGITKTIEQERIQKYGCADWYVWQTKNWGTKWNAYSQSCSESGEIQFETAWSTPSELILKLSQKYPEAVFCVKFADEDFGHNVGQYCCQDGEVIDSLIPDGGSELAYQMACEIMNDWDYITSRLEELEPQELKASWAQEFLKIAYRKSLFGDYTSYVWEHLKKLALEEENYEMAQKIKEHLAKENVD